MTKPIPEPLDPQEVLELARAVVSADRFPYLATIDGDQPRLRPVSPVRTDGFTVYVANLRAYHKTVEIAANPRVELCYLDDGHNQVRITGTAVTSFSVYGWNGPSKMRSVSSNATKEPRSMTAVRWAMRCTTSRSCVINT